MTPTQEILYWNVPQKKFVSPGLSFAKTQRLFMPIRTSFDLCIQAVNTTLFTPDVNGYAPSAARVSLSDYVGVPILAVKSLIDMLNGADEFAVAWSGYRTSLPWHDLSAGRFALGGGFISSDVEAGDNYAIAAQLATVNNGTFLAIPSSKPLLLSIIEPVVTGDEPDAPVPDPQYSGLATILENESSVDVTVTGLTALTGAILTLTQQYSGGDLSQFWGVITDGNLQINSMGVAPAEEYKIYWSLASL